jgi:hypothetical protein
MSNPAGALPGCAAIFIRLLPRRSARDLLDGVNATRAATTSFENLCDRAIQSAVHDVSLMKQDEVFETSAVAPVEFYSCNNEFHLLSSIAFFLQ